MAPRVTIDASAVAAFCHRHKIAKLSFFGSVLGDRFRPDSDVDVLIEFQPGCEVGLIALAEFEAELTEILGRRVDLRTPEDLSRYFRDQVVESAWVQYAA